MDARRCQSRTKQQSSALLLARVVGHRSATGAEMGLPGAGMKAAKTVTDTAAAAEGSPMTDLTRGVHAIAAAAEVLQGGPIDAAGRLRAAGIEAGG